MACFRFNFDFTCFTGSDNGVHRNHNMCIGLFFFYSLSHPLFLCLWEADLVPGLTSTWPRLYDCLLSSKVCIVIECCELCTCHHAFVRKMFTLWTVLQIFRVIHLKLSSVAKFSQLLNVSQDLLIEHHLLKGNIGRGIRLQPLLSPDLSTGQSWMGTLMKVGVPIPLVFVCHMEQD